MSIHLTSETIPHTVFQDSILPETASPETLFIEDSLWRMEVYVRRQGYEGYDLFDGLNSRLFKWTPLYRIPLFRLALLQFCKRSPVNLRPLLLVPKGFDPSGGAFFLMGHLNLFQVNGNPDHLAEAETLLQKLKQRALPRASGAGWGYNWDWQARAFFSPRKAPNLISSIYCGTAMLQAYRQWGDPEALALAVSVARFILDEMVLFEDETHLCFRYIPGENAEVHNASLKAAAYLTMVNEVSPLEGVAGKVMKAARFSIGHIREDGSWPYGTKPFHGWMDNFHTAYNIQSLIRIAAALGDDHADFAAELRQVVESVCRYYFEHLFAEDGTPKAYNTALYPIDAHVLAEVLILLARLSETTGLDLDFQRIRRIEQRTLTLIAEFQSPAGYFYYLKTAKGWNKIPYIRWCQGKMFYGLSKALLALSNKQKPATTLLQPV